MQVWLEKLITCHDGDLSTSLGKKPLPASHIS
jgi:hypothetical protein